MPRLRRLVRCFCSMCSARPSWRSSQRTWKPCIDAVWHTASTECLLRQCKIWKPVWRWILRINRRARSWREWSANCSQRTRRRRSRCAVSSKTGLETIKVFVGENKRLTWLYKTIEALFERSLSRNEQTIMRLDEIPFFKLIKQLQSRHTTLHFAKQNAPLDLARVEEIRVEMLHVLAEHFLVPKRKIALFLVFDLRVAR